VIGFTYLVLLVIALAGLAIIDRRWKLALFLDRKRTLITLALSVVLFLIWDLAGIALGIFFVGGSAYLTGLRVAPEVPIEELFFLTLLTYNALIIWQGGKRLWPRT
jgi:lycopene cyclase domain-containing protein